MNFLKRNWKAFLLFLVGPFAGSFFAYWYFQIRETPPNVGMGIAISSAITFVASAFGMQITISENSHEIKEKMEKVKNDFLEMQKDQLRSRVKIVELTGRDIDQMVLERIKDASLVRNTYINLAEKKSRLAKSEENSIKIYNDFLSRDDTCWIDITTPHDMSFDRYKKIEPLEVGAGSRHEVFVVNTQVDILNFLLIDKNNVTTDLFFGWVGENGKYFRVFWTHNQAMLDAFGDYFSSIKRSAVEHIVINYKDDVDFISQADMMIGRWVCVPQIERMQSIGMFDTYSILDISISNGVWSVRAEVFKVNNKNKIKQRVRIIESDMALFNDGRVFFEGVSRSVGGTQRKVAFGHFKPAPDYDNMMIGTYVAEDSTTIKRLFAYRADGIISGANYEDVSPIMQKIIAKRDLVMADDWNFKSKNST